MENKKYVRVKAQYREESGDYKGNPFIEALPAMKEDPKERMMSIVNKPVFTESDRRLSVTRRYAKLTSWINNLCIPLGWHDDVYEAVEVLIRNPYIGFKREDFARQQIQMNNQLKRIQSNSQDIRELTNDQLNDFKPSFCYLLTGLPGVGKTTAIDRFLADYPNCIDHSGSDWVSGELKQVPYLRISCPHPQGYRKALYQRLLTELYNSLGRKPEKFNGSIDDLENRTRRELANHFVGLVVIDEFTNILRGNSNTIDTFITELFNVLPCSVILTGGIANTDLSTKEAFTLRRAVKFGEMEVLNYSSEDRSWKRFCDKAWKCLQLTRNETPFTDEIREVMDSLTQGFVFLFVELYVDAQIRTMKKAQLAGTEDETITPDCLLEVAQTTRKRISEKIGLLKKATAIEVLDSPDLFKGRVVSSKKGTGGVAEKDQLKKKPLLRKIVELYKLRGYDTSYFPVTRLREIAKAYLDKSDLNQPLEALLDGAVRYFKDFVKEDKTSLPDVEAEELDLNEFLVKGDPDVA